MNSHITPIEPVIKGIIGRGGYGDVYRGRWGTRQVAIKKFHFHHPEYAEIVQEFKILEALRHRNIIQIYGITDIRGRTALVMDFAEGGSLKSAINLHKLDWSSKIRIAQEIVRGLAYIHEEGILHCDLKSANVLLTKQLEAKLADFHLATHALTTGSRSLSKGVQGTIRWLAPEDLVAKPKYSTNLMCMPLVVIEFVKNGIREDIPDDTPLEYRRLIKECWEHDPSSRPEAADMITYDDDYDDEAFVRQYR
ncbi:hypothetical protein BGW42_005499 [Actinomortierella wolfii]|nr:hypothetical protein BGW42_005499 [Actinomortierella wolfii]